MEAYLDNSATTRCADEVIDIVGKLMKEDYGNPSSKHMLGLTAEKYIKESKEILSGILKCQEKEIIFTSGGTESNNMAIIGTVMANKRNGNHIIVSSVEHPSVKEPARYLEEQGFRVSYLPVDRDGFISKDVLKNELCEDTILVSVMHVNNEVGAVQPIEEIGKAVHKFNPEIIFHVDAIQSFGKYKINPKKAGIDMLSVSAHKIHGPKGVGFLYIRDKVKVRPILFGGGQQKAMRSGTENVPGAAGLGIAAKLAYIDLEMKIDRMYECKEMFEAGIRNIPGTVINGSAGRASAPHILNVSFEGVKSEVLLHALEDRGIYVSSGSACSSNKPGLSSTLAAMGIGTDLMDSAIRFSFSYETTEEELKFCLEVLGELLPVLRKFVRS